MFSGSWNSSIFPFSLIIKVFICERRKERIHGWDFVFEKRTKCDRNKNGESIMLCVRVCGCVNVDEETKLNTR